MTTQNKRTNFHLKLALAIGLIIIALAAVHFTINSDAGAWIRSIHG